MMMVCILFWLLVAIEFYSNKLLIRGLESGAPCSALESMEPKHHGDGQKEKASLNFWIVAPDCFLKNESVEVKLTGDQLFRGFTLQARGGISHRTGMFDITGNTNVRYHCDDFAAITHKSADHEFTEVSVVWKSWTHMELGEGVAFKATVVTEKEEDWHVNILTISVIGTEPRCARYPSAQPTDKRNKQLQPPVLKKDQVHKTNAVPEHSFNFKEPTHKNRENVIIRSKASGHVLTVPIYAGVGDRWQDLATFENDSVEMRPIEFINGSVAKRQLWNIEPYFDYYFFIVSNLFHDDHLLHMKEPKKLYLTAMRKSSCVHPEQCYVAESLTVMARHNDIKNRREDERDQQQFWTLNGQNYEFIRSGLDNNASPNHLFIDHGPEEANDNIEGRNCDLEKFHSSDSGKWEERHKCLKNRETGDRKLFLTSPEIKNCMSDYHKKVVETDDLNHLGVYSKFEIIEATEKNLFPEKNEIISTGVKIQYVTIENFAEKRLLARQTWEQYDYSEDINNPEVKDPKDMDLELHGTHDDSMFLLRQIWIVKKHFGNAVFISPASSPSLVLESNPNKIDKKDRTTPIELYDRHLSVNLKHQYWKINTHEKGRKGFNFIELGIGADKTKDGKVTYKMMGANNTNINNKTKIQVFEIEDERNTRNDFKPFLLKIEAVEENKLPWMLRRRSPPIAIVHNETKKFWTVVESSDESHDVYKIRLRDYNKDAPIFQQFYFIRAFDINNGMGDKEWKDKSQRNYPWFYIVPAMNLNYAMEAYGYTGEPDCKKYPGKDEDPNLLTVISRIEKIKEDLTIFDNPSNFPYEMDKIYLDPEANPEPILPMSSQLFSIKAKEKGTWGTGGFLVSKLRGTTQELGDNGCIKNDAYRFLMPAKKDGDDLIGFTSMQTHYLPHGYTGEEPPASLEWSICHEWNEDGCLE